MENNKVHFTASYIIDPAHPITIALIGCGGTGSLILPRLARLDFALRELGKPGLHVTAYDGDKVEYHNQGRQNFTVNDIGKYKASSLIEKVNFSYGLQWDSVNKYINETNVPSANILITCVDNADFRMKLHKALQIECTDVPYRKRYYWLDSGNGKDFGQLILSTVKEIEQPKKSSYETTTALPSVVDIFGDLNEHDTIDVQGMASCSFAESIQKQDLFINDAVAVQAVNILWRLLKDYQITHHGVIINQATLQQRGIPIKA